MKSSSKKLVNYLLGKIGYEIRKSNSAVSSEIPLPHYDPQKEMVVPLGQRIYDPKVFDKYCVKTHKLVLLPPSHDNSILLDFDVMMNETQRKKYIDGLNCDRYTNILSMFSMLPPGRGICLDACVSMVNLRIKERIEEKGYEYTPIDICGGFGVRQEDFRKLSFPDQSVQCLISSDTLEHIVEYQDALREAYRVLVPGGFAIFHVPVYFIDKLENEPITAGIDPFGHVWYFSARKLLTDMREAGFSVIRAEMIFDYGALLCVLTKNI